MKVTPMTTVSELKASGQIWSLHDQTPVGALLSTGFAELDQALAGGFPAHTVVELHSPMGIGELRLLLPCLTRPAACSQLLALINPPLLIGSQMLQAAGIAADQVLLLQPANTQDALWAAEQCLKSGCCGSVILWQRTLSIAQLKRLQLCAQDGQASLFIFRGQRQTQCKIGGTAFVNNIPAVKFCNAVKRVYHWRIAASGRNYNVCYSLFQEQSGQLLTMFFCTYHLYFFTTENTE